MTGLSIIINIVVNIYDMAVIGSEVSLLSILPMGTTSANCPFDHVKLTILKQSYPSLYSFPPFVERGDSGPLRLIDFINVKKI